MKLKLKVYRGFASDQKLHISGHVFKKTDPSSFNLERSWLRYAYSMWRTFSIKTMSNVPVSLNFKGLHSIVYTDANGHFEFKLDHQIKLAPGWHEFTVHISENEEQVTSTGSILKAAEGRGIISDIDDTFLISHSASIVRKIYILLTRNINKRTFFKGVVKHYQQLANVDTPNLQPALFFYVSSSEWNLYNFIEKFATLHSLPQAVFFLKSIKSGVFDLLSSGGGQHQHKLVSIEYIFNFYPNRAFILLGDDTQQDPFIYSALTKKYPHQVVAIYIRQVGKRPKREVQELLLKIEENNILVCYFENSSIAMEHSRTHGLVEP